ncbi:siphovirus Gp157 family protein [Ligilactobacillus agilis]|uniref:siphovirus Gp157 family protein n=1 Tax=Ligilactobacillus agilis TaxID=1601 RepID=UPI00320B1D8E
MNLFELNQAYRELEERDDLDLETLKDTLDAIEGAREVKLDSLASWIEKNKMQIDWVTEKVKDLQAKKASLTNLNKSLQGYMTQSLDDAGIKELQTKNHILKPRNYKASVVVDSLDDLPEEFKQTKTEVTADKKELYKVLKDGQEVPGVHLKPNRGTVIK